MEVNSHLSRTDSGTDSGTDSDTNSGTDNAGGAAHVNTTGALLSVSLAAHRCDTAHRCGTTLVKPAIHVILVRRSLSGAPASSETEHVPETPFQMPKSDHTKAPAIGREYTGTITKQHTITLVWSTHQKHTLISDADTMYRSGKLQFISRDLIDRPGQWVALPNSRKQNLAMFLVSQLGLHNVRGSYHLGNLH